MSRMKVSIGDATFAQALAAPKVRAAVLATAQSQLARVKFLAYKAGRIHFGDNLRVEAGVRPGAKAAYGQARPYGRITSTTTKAEQAEDDRGAKLSRTQILRRVARG